VNIGIDIKALRSGKAGIAVYIANTLDQLQEIDRENNYFLFEKTPSSYRIVNPRWKKVLVPSKLPGTLWLMLKVPFHFSKYSLDVFWGPEQIIPCVFDPGRVKMVSTVLDLALKRCPATMQTTNYFINRIFLKKSILRSCKILTISNSIKRDICFFYPDKAVPGKVTVTYPGRPAWPEVPQDVERGQHLLFVGSFEPRKNLLNLLKALVVLKNEKKQEISLRIVGPAGWKNNSARAYMEENGLASQIAFSGYVDENALIKEYCGCKASVYPSLYEGFGLPVLESLATQTPVLSSRGTSMEEIAGECIVLFDAEDPRDIAEKIMSVYRSGFDADAYLRRSKEVLKRFSWETTARQTLEVLKDAYRLPRLI
jgi:glycosyltransferase involved in cell wall biosynthesis